jgi:hypothetical protein
VSALRIATLLVEAGVLAIRPIGAANNNERRVGGREGLLMPSEAEKYWQYSRECTKQALEAETPELRDQLLGLARVWTEAALREQMNIESSAGARRVSPAVRGRVPAAKRS